MENPFHFEALIREQARLLLKISVAKEAVDAARTILEKYEKEYAANDERIRSDAMKYFKETGVTTTTSRCQSA